MFRYRSICILGVFTVAIYCAPELIAQEMIFNRYALSEGLMSPTVYCAAQCRDGYIWFGTDAGVSRFDGYRFENFTTDDGLCDNEVLRIREDSKGRIWFLSLSGCLAYFQQGKIISTINDPGLRAEIQTLGTSCFAEDNSGAVWFSGMDTRVVCYNNNKTEIVQFVSQNDEIVRSNVYLFHDSVGNVLFQDHAQIGFKNNEGQLQFMPNNRKRPLPNCFFDNGRESFALVDQGLYDFGANTMIDVPELNLISNLPMAIGLSVYNESMWIPSGELGVDHWVKKNGEWEFDRKYFANDWVNFVLEDKERNAWFCTRDNGVYCLLPQRKNQYYIDLKRGYQATSLARSKDAIFFGTNTGEIFKVFPEDGNRFELFYDFKQGNGIEDLIVDSDDNLIVRTATNAYLFFSGSQSPLDLSNMHPKVLFDGADNRLYLSMLSGISYLDKTLFPKLKLERLNQIPASRIYNIYTDQNQNLWFENHDKLFNLSNDHLQEVAAFNAVSRGRISTITGTVDNDILVSTMGSGLYRITGDGILQTLSRENGLPSNECEWVRVFDQTALILTSAGLVSCDLSNHSLTLVHHYGATDGIPDAKIYDVLELEGVMYLATHKGLFFLPALNVPYVSLPPNVHISAIWCNGIEQTPGDIRIPYGENLKLDFTAIAFDMPEALTFQYSFNSNPESWTTTTNRSIEISSLDWGEHIFQIRARKYDSEWSLPVTVRIFVLPPVWATWWFRALGACVLAGIVYLLFVFLARRKYRRQLRILEQQQVLLKERNRISTDLHDDIGAELSNIVILSRIARSRISSNDNPSDYIHKIDISASDVISKMNGIIWSLNPSNDNLQNLVDYIRKYVQDFLEINDLSGNVRVEGEADKTEIKALVRRNTFLIVKEALHNVGKHATANRIEVFIRIFTDHLIVEISDNGKGFDQGNTRPEGLGLGSMKRRTTDMGGILSIESSPGMGTRLSLQIPR